MINGKIPVITEIEKNINQMKISIAKLLMSSLIGLPIYPHSLQILVCIISPPLHAAIVMVSEFQLRDKVTQETDW